ncbi:TPA: transposase [Legionella pneumophila]|nr:hypothetical protein [Legionella pneumophila]HAT8309924.1 hypothetical protein [Legionella pneumophila]HAU0215837.1 hypothetical protein [Legionella pneumophila]HAU1061928.1 hypothetical protein [Legionella pneumophila]HAU1204285.1 hypothetical protein [Legionella pneumophila]
MLCALTIKQLFNLPYRTTEGFPGSLIKLNQLDISTPDHTTLCRRAKTLKVDLSARATNKPRHILIDSTGVKWLVKANGNN